MEKRKYGFTLQSRTKRLAIWKKQGILSAHVKGNGFCRHTDRQLPQKVLFPAKGVTRRHERFQTSFRERSQLLFHQQESPLFRRPSFPADFRHLLQNFTPVQT